MIKTILKPLLVLCLFTASISAKNESIPAKEASLDITASSDKLAVCFDSDPITYMASELEAITTVNTDTPSLMITGLFSHNQRSERGIELYVLKDIPDLSIYAIGVVNIGVVYEGPEFYLSGSATAGQFIYLALYPDSFQDFVGFAPDIDLGGNSTLSASGNEAVELYVDDSGIPTLIDVYGNAFESGSEKPWDYRSSWVYRKNDAGPDTTFNVNDWRIPSPFIFTGYTTNLEAPVPFPYGTYGQPYDEIPPIASCQDVDFVANLGNFRLDPSLMGSNSSDNVGITLMLLDDNSFVCSDKGLNEVVLTAYDAAGNKDTCSATVEVTLAEPQIFCQDKTVNLNFDGQVSVDVADLRVGFDGACWGEGSPFFLSTTNLLNSGNGNFTGATTVNSPLDTVITGDDPFYYEVFTFTVPTDGLYVPQFTLSSNDEEILFVIVSEEPIVPNSGEINERVGFLDGFAFEAPGVYRGSFSGEDEVFLTADTTYYIQVATDVPLTFSGTINEGGGAGEAFDAYTFTTEDLGENTLYVFGIDDAGNTTSCTSTVTVRELNPFITTWKTDNPGTSDSLQITIPTHEPSWRDYRFDIDWGDGTFSYNRSFSPTHTYDSAGVYTVRITGDFPQIFFNFGGDREKLLTIEQWGDIQWSSMQDAFEGCSNLNITNPDIDRPDLSRVTSLASMFRGCSAFNGAIGHWDVGNVQIFDELFTFCEVFNQDIGGWDMSSATSLFQMLRGNYKFNQDLNAWDVSNVTNMEGLFFFTETFNQDLNNWDVSKVTSMAEMFYVNNVFNGDIKTWDVRNVENMNGMFLEAFSFNQDISGWNVSKVKDMTDMFASAINFNQDIGNWDVSKVTNMIGTFRNAQAFNQDIGDWEVGNVTSMAAMFLEAVSFNQDISDWEVGKVTEMDDMFERAVSFDQDLGKWDIGSLVKNEFSNGLRHMFKDGGLSIANYDATLIGWHTDTSGAAGDGIDDIPFDITFGGGNSQYCAADSARQDLIDTYRWSISDAGQDCLSVDVDDLAFGHEITMHPNPSSDFVYFKGDLKDVRGVEIFNLKGQRVMIFNNNLNEFNISQLPPSLYLVKLFSERSFRTFKLIKE